MSIAAATDRIEKELVIKAPRSRVWRALSNAGEFGNWFGAKLEDKPFVPGARMQGQFTIPGHEHKVLELTVERVDPETYFSYRWHPCSGNPADHSNEPPTLVEFELSEVDGNTLLRLTESGFDSLPAERRADAFRSNSGGWDFQLQNIARYAEAQ